MEEVIDLTEESPARGDGARPPTPSSEMLLAVDPLRRAPASPGRQPDFSGTESEDESQAPLPPLPEAAPVELLDSDDSTDGGSSSLGSSSFGGGSSSFGGSSFGGGSSSFGGSSFGGSSFGGGGSSFGGGSGGGGSGGSRSEQTDSEDDRPVPVVSRPAPRQDDRPISLSSDDSDDDELLARAPLAARLGVPSRLPPDLDDEDDEDDEDDDDALLAAPAPLTKRQRQAAEKEAAKAARKREREAAQAARRQEKEAQKERARLARTSAKRQRGAFAHTEVCVHVPEALGEHEAVAGLRETYAQSREARGPSWCVRFSMLVGERQQRRLWQPVVVVLLTGADLAAVLAEGRPQVAEWAALVRSLGPPAPLQIWLLERAGAAVTAKQRRRSTSSAVATPEALKELQAWLTTRVGAQSSVTHHPAETLDRLRDITRRVAERRYQPLPTALAAVPKLTSRAPSGCALQRSWLHCLESIPGVSEPKAQALLRVYPSAHSMLRPLRDGTLTAAHLEGQIVAGRTERVLAARVARVFTEEDCEVEV